MLPKTLGKLTLQKCATIKKGAVSKVVFQFRDAPFVCQKTLLYQCFGVIKFNELSGEFPFINNGLS